MITIDGSRGEGGGQIVRTALGLSVATGTPFRIENIRAGRKKPGLLRQHLTAVQAAATIGRATVDGAAVGSSALTFAPSAVEPGDYTFSIGTAGSATLVLQAILPPLLGARTRTTLVLEGGTHNPWAPPFDFLDRVLLPIVNRLGPRVEARLERHGFYPAGGGRFTVTIDPAAERARLTLLDRGDIRERRVRALVAHLPRHIAARELTTVARLMNWREEWGAVEAITDTSGPGNAVLIEIASEHAAEICTGFGETGTPAEAIANRAAHEARRYLAANVPVGAHLADQLLPFLALGAGGSYRTVAPTPHTLTNIEVVRRFCDVSIAVEPDGHDVVRIDIGV